jgi:hypothetical protein
VYTTITICVLTALSPFQNGYVLRNAKLSLGGGLAINTVILIAYGQRDISYKNYTAAMSLGHGLCVAGCYAIILRYRYPVSSSKVGWKLIAGGLFCGMSTCVAAFLNLAGMRTGRWRSPLNCGHGNEVPFSSTGLNVASGAIPTLSATSIISAGWPVNKTRPKLWWRCSVVGIFLWEAGGITVVESALILYSGYDPNYASEAAKWMLGQSWKFLFKTIQFAVILFFHNGAYHASTWDPSSIRMRTCEGKIGYE